jgi:hypothetical protein
MIGMLRRARARVALLAPATKARAQSLPPHRRSQVAWLRGRLAERNGARVLGVGRFDPALATELLALGADIVDQRPLNREANIITDLAIDGAALAGPYDLVVAQEPGAASSRTERMLPTLVAALTDDGRMLLTTGRDDLTEVAVRALGGVHVDAEPIRAGFGLEVTVP